MIKYLVKSTSVATPENRNFAGETSIYYYGKKGEVLCVEGDHAKRCHDERPMWMWGVREYGYDRISDAKRNWSFKNPQNDEYWKTTVEIVEVEC